MRPRLAADDLVDQYAEAVDPVYWDNIQARVTTFNENLERVRQYIQNTDRVLEIGSYCGAFLKVARDAGIDITGVEPSAWAVEQSRKITDAPVVCGTTEDLPEDAGPFDVVTAWDVLEHFYDPVTELRKINGLLKDGGTLLFSTLMIDNWFPKVTGKHWPWLMDMHLFYFTETTIRQVLADTGFELVSDIKYTHVITLEYLLDKLGTLGVPLAGRLSGAMTKTPLAKTQIPFRFGDIKLFVCRKARDIGPAQSARRVRPSISFVGGHGQTEARVPA
jgi:2-polyprenyl-3-methyl-5-hydroxy-6-metoxy-1,4-benzoquinol methylase